MSTIREIARELSLSHTTVSRVLNTRHEQTISPATRERVWSAARRMGYQPHVAARALATGRSQTVALLMHYLYTAFHAEVVNAVEQALRRSGYQVLVATVDWYTETERDTLPVLPGPVDGYLAFETASHVSKVLAGRETTSGKPVPVVAMGGHNLGVGSDTIAFDLAAGTDMALEHLLALGKRRIAFVTEGHHDPRRERYRETMRRVGMPETLIKVPSQQRKQVREAVRQCFADPAQWKRSDTRPDALFCFNDEVAIGTYRALRDLKIGVGSEIALVGFDGIEDSEYLDTPLTTVALPIQDMCLLAWKTLQERLEHPDAPPERTVLRPSLIVRESTVPIP